MKKYQVIGVKEILEGVKEYELPCLDSRKSFYGKAHVIELTSGIKYLESYDTIVAKIENGKLSRLWSGWSATTGRHVSSFSLMFLGAPMGKAAWDRLEVA